MTMNNKDKAWKYIELTCEVGLAILLLIALLPLLYILGSLLWFMFSIVWFMLKLVLTIIGCLMPFMIPFALYELYQLKTNKEEE